MRARRPAEREARSNIVEMQRDAPAGTSASSRAQEVGFTLMAGGPLYQLWRRTRLAGEALQRPLRRGCSPPSCSRGCRCCCCRRPRETPGAAALPPSDEPLLGSADIQSLADPCNGFKVAKDIRIAPFDMKNVPALAVITVLPVAPLLLTTFSVEQILARVLEVLLRAPRRRFGTLLHGRLPGPCANRCVSEFVARLRRPMEVERSPGTQWRFHDGPGRRRALQRASPVPLCSLEGP